MPSTVERDKLPQTVGPGHCRAYSIPEQKTPTLHGGGVCVCAGIIKKGGLGCFLSQQHSLALIELWEKECHKHQDMMQEQSSKRRNTWKALGSRASGQYTARANTCAILNYYSWVLRPLGIEPGNVWPLNS